MKRLLANTLLLCTVSLVLLLTAEGALRLWPPAELSVRMKLLQPNRVHGTITENTDANWEVERIEGKIVRFVPHSSFVVRTNEYAHTVAISEEGGRKTPQVDGQTVAFLGDSFTLGVGVNDDEAFASLLGPTLKRRILNLGIPGSTLSNQVDQLELLHSTIRPSAYVIFVYTANDLSDLLAQSKKQIATELPSANSNGRRSILWELNALAKKLKLSQHSFFYNWLKSTLLRVLNRNSPIYSEPLFWITANATAQQEALELFTTQLQRLISLASTYQVPVAVVLVPAKEQVSDEGFARSADYYNATLRQEEIIDLNDKLSAQIRSINLDTTDPTACLRQSSQPSSLYYGIDDHFTATGHRRFADCIAPWLAEWLAAHDTSSP